MREGKGWKEKSIASPGVTAAVIAFKSEGSHFSHPELCRRKLLVIFCLHYQILKEFTENLCVFSFYLQSGLTLLLTIFTALLCTIKILCFNTCCK